MTESIYAPRQPAGPGAALRSVGVLVGVLAGLSAVAAVVGSVAVFEHTSCAATAFGTCYAQTRPWVAEGWAVLVGGLLNAFIIGVVAHLCIRVADMQPLRETAA